MPRAEPKQPIGVPQSVYKQIEEYARSHNLFIFEVVVKMWEQFIIKPKGRPRTCKN